MSTLKTKVDSEEVFDFLKKNFATDIPSLTPIKAGETSQAFLFSSKDGEFVVRVHSKKHGFEKDKYAYEHFGSEDIPVPKMLQMGQLNGQLYYAITEKAKGKIIDHFAKDEIRTFIPELIKTLDAIRNLDIKNTTQFGDWDSDGRASEVTWKDYLAKLIEDFSSYSERSEEKGSRSGSYNDKRAEGALLEKNIVEKILAHYKPLIDYCPNILHLVHGDVGFNNMFSDGNKITGVIDWELSKYGDFLYDVAWLSFWETEIDYAGIFLKHYEAEGVSVPNFRERMLCYKLHFGLGSLQFASDSGQEDTYRWTKDRLLSLLTMIST